MNKAPCCSVCGKTLGPKVFLDVLAIERGGRFRLTCDAEDEQHDEDVWHGSCKIQSTEHAMEVLHHFGIKNWVNPCRVLRVLWPWLRLQSWHDAGYPT